MELVVAKSIELDIGNWKQTANKKGLNRWGVDWTKSLPPEVKIECVNDENCLKNYLEEKYYKTGVIDKAIGELQESIDRYPIQADLENMIGKRFVEEIITIYITTISRAPYNLQKSYFYVIYRDKDLLREVSGVYHELQHFLFHKYSWQMCLDSGLSDTQTDDLKESMTVLLNKKLEERELPLDKGYPNHKVIRQKIKVLSNEGMGYDELLAEAINWLKITPKEVLVPPKPIVI